MVYTTVWKANIREYAVKMEMEREKLKNKAICTEEITEATQAQSYVCYFKSIIDQDRSAVVICNLQHEIIYMNPAAIKNYAKGGGNKLLGRSLLECHNMESRDKINRVLEWFAVSPENNIVYTFHNEKQNKDVYMVALRDGEKLIGYYEKHEYRNLETMKMYDMGDGC